ncbi:MAG: FAD-dependent oxidoreductase [Hyphomicrobium aestuarii]|nr:FAD-dependent oxidoreductase [Hyphomicrobium aestuarii]
MTASKLTITIVGAGVVGLWQAVTLARAGHRVRVIERSPATDPFRASASRYAGAMIAPDTEAEAAPPIVRDLGRQAYDIWADTVPVSQRGSLVVASIREPGELKRFARLTEGHVMLGRDAVAALEPDLGGRFETALHFAAEAHVAALDALTALLAAAREAGATFDFGIDADSETAQDDTSRSGAAAPDWTIDCRGLAASRDIPTLRGVRGERLLLHADGVTFTRPVRYLDPRTPIYIVPWPGHVYMVGATVIESDESGPMSVRSAVELMAAVCALHPGFAEATIIDFGAGVRPSLPDNVPRALVDKRRRTIRVNGAYRHGFLLAPILARSVSRMLDGAEAEPLVEGHL